MKRTQHYDENGNLVDADARKEKDETWSINVWMGNLGGTARKVRRHYYRSKMEALNGRLTDSIGTAGRVR